MTAEEYVVQKLEDAEARLKYMEEIIESQKGEMETLYRAIRRIAQEAREDANGNVWISGFFAKFANEETPVYKAFDMMAIYIAKEETKAEQDEKVEQKQDEKEEETE